MSDAPRATDLEDIQGLVYSAWNKHRHAGFVFARLGEDVQRSRAWLAELATRVTPAARPLRPLHGRRVQVALGPGGLAALGVPREVCSAMPQELEQGMAARTRVLGDDDPAAWQLGKPGERLDALVLLYADDAAARDAMIDQERGALAAAGAHVYPVELSCAMAGREHFGFADGISQPFVPGMHGSPRPGEDVVATGEIVLGYPNAYGKLPNAPRWGDFDFGRNGTYLVFRKLHQDVAGLWGWVAEQARALVGDNPQALAHATDLLGAKLMGRWRSGAPLVLTPERDDPELAKSEHRNAFDFLELDPDGLRCPIAAHVRRANPRDARGGSADESRLVVNRHRIVRRGRSFGAPLDLHAARAGRDDGTPRGLYFISLQASIARGFEFIQQTWLANPGFHGLCGEPDPISGNGDGSYHVTIPADPLRLRLPRVPRVVTVAGGGYFFLPSLAALRRMAAG